MDTPLPPAVPPLNLAQLLSRINAALPDNDSQGISPEDVRSRLLELAASAQLLVNVPPPATESFQPLDAALTSLSNLSGGPDKLPYFTALDTFALTNLSAYGRALIEVPNAAGAATVLGLGTAAAKNTGTSGNAVPLLDGANTWSAAQTITGGGLQVGAPTGGNKGAGTVNASTLYEDGVALSVKYQAAAGGAQPLDATLTAFAALVGASDRLPYFTGVDAFALASFTSFARTFVASADAAAAQVALSLGTAATQNTGTSGANIPLLSAANTWSAIQTIDLGAALGAGLNITSSDAGNAAGPNFSISRASASPAALDNLGMLSFVGRDSVNTATTYTRISNQIVDPTDASEAGAMVFQALVAGSLASAMVVAAGVRIGSPIGGDKGAGTLNAVTFYEAGVALNVKYGSGYTAQAADADVTLTVGTSGEKQKFTGTLTAARAVTLSTTGAVAGSSYIITRTGGGAFNLNVGTGPLKALATGQWCIVAYDGAAWYLAAFGSL